MSKLSTKIFLIIFSFSFLAVAFIASVLILYSEDILNKYAGEYQSSIAEGSLNSIERGFRIRIQATEEIANLNETREILNKNADQQDSDSRTKNLSRVVSGAVEVSIIDINGKIVTSSDTQKNGTVDEEEHSVELQQESLKNSRSSSSNIFINDNYASSIFLALSPIKEEKTGIVIGFVKIVFSSAFIENELQGIAAGGPKIHLVDSLGTMLAHNQVEGSEDHTMKDGENLKDSPIVKIAISGTAKYARATALSGMGDSFYGIAHENKGDERDKNEWIIIVEKDYDTLFGPIKKSIYLMIFIVMLLIFGCSAGAIFFTQIAISDPINKIIYAIKKIPALGSYEAPAIKSGNELDQLNTAFVASFEELSKLKSNLEKRVLEKTNDMEKVIRETALQNVNLENTKRAMINILEDAKELERFVTNEKNKAEAIIASMGEGLIMVDKEYTVTLINRVTEEILGLEGKKIMGADLKSILQIIKKTTVLKPEERPISQVLKNGKTITAGVSDEFFGKTEKREFPLAFIVSPIKDSISNEITGAVVIFRDITDDKRLNDAKTNFISVASHQLRTPLTSMRWLSEMLLDGDAGKLDEEQAHFVQRIEDSAERMVNLVNLLLQIARVEAGRIMVEPTPVSLKDLSAEVAESITLTLKAKLQTVEIKSEPESLPKLLLDKDIMWQVVQNLLTNANRYGTPKSSIKVVIAQKGEEIEYSVHNDGIGIPAKQKDRIFEKFFRADNAVKAVPEGSGLGLSLVKSVVNSWGGKVWFESSEGKGATFYFTISKDGMKPKKGEVKLSI